jgi:hypothetical protein
MKKMTRELAPIFCLALLQGCGGGGGSGKPPAAQQPPPSNARSALKLSSANYQNALRASVGMSLSAFNFVKLGGFMSDNLFEKPIPGSVSALLCPDGGWTLLSIGDRNLDTFFNVGDYVTQTYDKCKNGGSTIDGIIRIELRGVTPKDGGRELESWVTVVNFTVTSATNSVSSTSLNFTGPVLYTNAPAYQQFKLGGAAFSSTNVAGTEQASALVVDFLQRQDTGTFSLSFGGNLDSGAFDGTFDFATTTPFTGAIGAYPTSGRVVVLGGSNTTARLSEEGAAANDADTVLLAVDETGDGNADASLIDFAWMGIVPRQMFDPFVNLVVVTQP